ncbi:hypothetical protein B0S90_2904 [Caldicellulosiruptor bescii]|uniref:Uncharacterized protein n=2 Tax=Caldicellulosiruptor bescii TaxID=31899 RepID=B9MSA8_CALBD|nr:hypothetical protein Athe_2775 [Caldicellulosiruptor bescii DSM 6725]PBD02493.1 hypothetical protein B0S90_2904 [Caldicellulosiruptor bescii]PFH13073.1 hypothetical protein B0S93_2898 [Caldicellulosiruptor bescii]PFH19983.1 hypothetical protein B0S91_2860 [Caldicellulosiruptor bescii]PFH30570.1 hypothetical protein B0S92_0003 [Caldicellulosiruptor bescii]
MTQNGDWMSRNAGFCIVTFVTLKKKALKWRMSYKAATQ